MDELILNHEYWMNMAFKEAEKAYNVGEVPIGAVIVHGTDLIAKGYNMVETLQDPTAHAEMLAITSAAESLGSRRLLDCTLYVTLEPCLMCSGAIIQARIPHVVFGAHDPKAGAVQTLYQTLQDSRLNHTCQVTAGILAQKCSYILTDFFKKLRETN